MQINTSDVALSSSIIWSVNAALAVDSCSVRPYYKGRQEQRPAASDQGQLEGQINSSTG